MSLISQLLLHLPPNTTRRVLEDVVIWVFLLVKKDTQDREKMNSLFAVLYLTSIKKRGFYKKQQNKKPFSFSTLNEELTDK